MHKSDRKSCKPGLIYAKKTFTMPLQVLQLRLILKFPLLTLKKKILQYYLSNLYLQIFIEIIKKSLKSHRLLLCKLKIFYFI